MLFYFLQVSTFTVKMNAYFLWFETSANENPVVLILTNELKILTATNLFYYINEKYIAKKN